MSRISLFTIELRHESDVVFIRQRARALSGLLKFDSQDQVRIATAISEIARNAFQYAGGGRAEFSLAKTSLSAPQSLQVSIRDQGPGIANLREILNGDYVSRTGMGVGLLGATKLMDHVDIQSKPGQGTTVLLRKDRPSNLPDIEQKELLKVIQKMISTTQERPLEDVRVNNLDLFHALNELSAKQEDLERVNAELENTNRGVLALYTELDEKASELKRASAAKTAFLSNMTHEFRSPLNSMLNISALLLDPESGLKDPDHIRQVEFIRKSARDLSELVNDLLDLAKVEAGKIAVRKSEFLSDELFGALRGLMKPLLVTQPGVELTFEEPAPVRLYTDEGKLSQILRNLISNAIKYTERGEVRVRIAEQGHDVVFSVSDTGVGIAPEDLDRIFEEFVQLESPLQNRSKGTGLGLSLTRRLTELLGGSISVESRVGEGSTFTVRIPRSYEGVTEGTYLPGLESKNLFRPRPFREDSVFLLIDDQEADRRILRHQLESLGLRVEEAASGRQGVALAKRLKPHLIFLDLSMPEMDGFDVLRSLMSDPETRALRVAIHSSKILDPEEARYFETVGVPTLLKGSVSDPTDLGKLHQLLRDSGVPVPEARKEQSQ